MDKWPTGWRAVVGVLGFGLGGVAFALERARADDTIGVIGGVVGATIGLMILIVGTVGWLRTRGRADRNGPGADDLPGPRT